VPAEGDAVSEASEVELREWEEEQEAEELGAGEGSPLFLPTPDFMVPAGEGWAVSGVSFPLSFPLLFSWCAPHLLGTGWAEGKGELATCRHRAYSGQETDCT